MARLLRRFAPGVLIASTLALGCLAGPRHRRLGVAAAGAGCAAPTPPPQELTEARAGALGSSVGPNGQEGDSAAAAAAVEAGSSDAPGASPDDPGQGNDVDAGDAGDPTFLLAAPGSTPAVTYASLTGGSCEQELKKRGVSYVAAPGSPRGVERPVRLTGRLHGVDFHGVGSASQRAKSVFEIVDCRLVLALDDFAAILEKYEVVEAIHMSMYRPPSAKRKVAKKFKEHEAALAIDLGTLVKRDGSKLSVLDDFHGSIGSKKTCGAGASPYPTAKAGVELRTILCEAYDRKLFNVMLTPNFNKPHQNHFHLEVTRGVKWFILH